MVAELRQHGDGDRADAAGGAVDDHRAVRRLEAVVLHAHDGDARGVAGGAESHGLPQRQAGRHLGDPVALDPRVARVAAVVRDADVFAARREHGVALGEARIGRRDYGPGKVNAAYARLSS